MPNRSTSRPLYLEGLNGLRFIAAFFVVMQHAHESLRHLGLADAVNRVVVFDRGRAAVDFFFTLSGFLITYLLVRERDTRGTVSLRRFYLRRAARIWPIYFSVVVIGFGLLGGLYPRMYHAQYFDFDILTGLALYILFLPNLMGSFYKVGLLLPLWSIGVEEQFYLFWAPLVKWFGHRLLRLSLVFLAVMLTFYTLVESGLISSNRAMWLFLETLRFHYMAIGSLFGWILYRHADAYKRSVFASYTFQTLALACLIYHFVFGLNGGRLGILLDVVLGGLYGTLILNVSIAPKRLLRLEWEPLVYLGKISYGIYMFHMTVDYALRSLFSALGVAGRVSTPTSVVYGCLLLLTTVVMAHFSFTYVESYFIRKSRAGGVDQSRGHSAGVAPA